MKESSHATVEPRYRNNCEGDENRNAEWCRERDQRVMRFFCQHRRAIEDAERDSCCSRVGIQRPLKRLIWLLSLSLLPLACSQTPTAPATVTPTVPATDRPVAPSRSPTGPPTDGPNATAAPALSPTPTKRPSARPTVLQQPTGSPTTAPTITPRPTGAPSVRPTDLPSAEPSVAPTAEPTFSDEIKATTVFNQRFQIQNNLEFNDTEQVVFCENMVSYTDDFGGRNDERVNSSCIILSQILQVIGGTRRALREGRNDGILEFLLNSARRLQVVFNQVEYSMTYRSNHTNVTAYPALFQNFINSDLDRVTTDLQNRSLAVENSFLAFNNIATVAPTTIPSMTLSPSTVTGEPSLQSIGPTTAPSPSFSRDPAIPVVTEMPTMAPSELPPASTRKGAEHATIIASSVIGAMAVVMATLFMFYRQRKRQQERKFQAEAAMGRRNGATGAHDGSHGQMRIDPRAAYQNALNSGKQNLPGMISPANSFLSKESLLSAGPSPLSDTSEREEDGTHLLTDEFDQYKDQNLERMRTSVEGNLSGFDGMMSQALTKALMDDDHETVDPENLRWGGSGDSIEIEATALCEVTDWLKRKEGATLEERGAFMQVNLDRMVASVRHGFMDPECASRTIHECGALLGLQLAHDIPGNALIVTGMPRMVKTPDFITAFSKFGEIESAAVSSNSRGFGLVRFKSIKSVQAALAQFRTSAIVVHDVEVQVRQLRTEETARGSDFSPPAGQSVSRHSSRAASPIVQRVQS